MRKGISGASRAPRNGTIIVFISMILYIIFFTCVGERGYREFTDSYQYIDSWGAQGIMPIYPLFIQIHRILLGEEHFLVGVVVSQTIIAVLCLTVYLDWYRRRFQPGTIAILLTAVVCIVPLTLDFPDVLINHCILTEALAYPLFYLFAIACAELMIRKSWTGLVPMWVMAVLLALIRSQMQVLIGFVILGALYVCWHRAIGKGAGKKVLAAVFTIIGPIAILLFSESFILRAHGALRGCLYEIRSHIQTEIVMDDAGSLKLSITALPVNVKSQDSSSMTGQMRSVILCRVLYEMDEADVELFTDADTKDFYRTVYEESDRLKNRYVYCRNDLMAWEDIMNGIAGGSIVMPKAIENYNISHEQVPLEKIERMQWDIALRLLKKHWARAMLHTMCMLPHGLLCTVAFLVNPQGLCYLYTVLVYIAAIIIFFVGYRKGEKYRSRSENLLGMLILNAGMAVVICTVFFGMQRYLIYGFGVFYAAVIAAVEPFLRKVCSAKFVR